MYQKYINSIYWQESCFLRYSKNLKIGILGGSFNPAHKGHLHLSIQAIKKLNLDLVIWLITPLNPNKSYMKQNTLSLKKRIENAKLIINKHPKIKVSVFEEAFLFYYTNMTLQSLQKLNTFNNEIYFLIGEDNLASFEIFTNWKYLLKNYNIAAFTRDKNSYKSLNTKWSIYRKLNCLSYINSSPNKIDELSKTALYYYLIPHINISSSEIRENNNYNKKR